MRSEPTVPQTARADLRILPFDLNPKLEEDSPPAQPLFIQVDKLRGHRFVDISDEMPFRVRMRLANDLEEDRIIYDRLFEQLLRTPPAYDWPLSQQAQLSLTFGKPVNQQKVSFVRRPFSYDEQAVVRLKPQLLQQLTALDIFYNWLVLAREKIEQDQLSFSVVWEMFYLEVWRCHSPIAIPFGSAGFRELFYSTRKAGTRPELVTAHQLVYAFTCGRWHSQIGSLESGNSLPLTNDYDLVLRAPPILHDPLPVTFHIVRQEGQPPIPTTKRLAAIYIIRPSEAIDTFSDWNDRNYWPVLIQYK